VPGVLAASAVAQHSVLLAVKAVQRASPGQHVHFQLVKQLGEQPRWYRVTRGASAKVYHIFHLAAHPLVSGMRQATVQGAVHFRHAACSSVLLPLPCRSSSHARSIPQTCQRC
jgi:hypothetical protein